MEEDIYQEHIMDHYQHPRHRYIQKNPTYSLTQLNPLCGDELTIQITLSKSNNKNTNPEIQDISFQGHGCAISQAAASILTEYANKKTIDQIQNMTDKEMIDLLHIPISHTRSKCALLALKTTNAAIKNAQETRKAIPQKHHKIIKSKKQTKKPTKQK